MKKIILLILSAILLFALAVPAMAAGTTSATPSTNTAHRGDTFTVTVSVSTEGIKGGQIEVKCGSAFELVKYEYLADPTLKTFDISKGIGVFTFGSERAMSGKLIKFTFKVNSDAKFATDSITVYLSTTGTDAIEKETKVNVTVTCKHEYTAWTPSETDTESHIHKCNICGREETQAHTYDNLCDVDCNDCGAVRVTEHVFAEEWLSDQTGHWHACVHCGALSETEDHVPGAAAGEYTDQTCTVCQFVLNSALGHTHKYDGTYKTDAVFHWTKCIGCGETTEQVLHVFESECDETCDICGYKRRVPHNISESWSCNDENHWRFCVDCGWIVDKGTHIWTDATVILEATESAEGQMHYHCGLCTAEKIERIPVKEKTGGNTSWWLWLLIGIAGGVIITLTVSAVIALTSTKKHKGRYSH